MQLLAHLDMMTRRRRREEEEGEEGTRKAQATERTRAWAGCKHREQGHYPEHAVRPCFNWASRHRDDPVGATHGKYAH